jgi:hypothetical protein
VNGHKCTDCNQVYVDEDLNIVLAGRGLLACLFRPMFHMILRSWHMCPLGFLFGLGFDTATEVGLLGISATQASQGLSVWSVLARNVHASRCLSDNRRYALSMRGDQPFVGPTSDKGAITGHVEAGQGCQHKYLITDAAAICVVDWMVRSASW